MRAITKKKAKELPWVTLSSAGAFWVLKETFLGFSAGKSQVKALRDEQGEHPGTINPGGSVESPKLWECRERGLEQFVNVFNNTPERWEGEWRARRSQTNQIPAPPGKINSFRALEMAKSTLKQKKKINSIYRQTVTAQRNTHLGVHKSLQHLLLCWGKEFTALPKHPNLSPKMGPAAAFRWVVPPSEFNDGQRNQSFIPAARNAAAQRAMF